MAERVIKPKVKTGNNTADEIKIPYNVLSNPPDLSVYVTTENTTQNIGGKKTVVTPPATDDSTQIANTSWVRTNYQEKGYAGIDGAVVNSDGKVTDKDGNVVDALYFKVASLTTTKAYMRTYLLAEVAMTNIVNEQSTVLIRCTTESSTSAPNVTITFDNYSYASLLLPKNIFVTADYKSGTAGATFTVWVKQDKDFMQQVWNVLSQNTRNYTTTSKREWRVFYSNITKATAVTDINAAPTGYTRIVANNNNRYSNLEENTYLWQQSQNAGITWKRYSDNTTRGVFRHNDDGTTETFVAQSDGFLFRPLNNNNTKSIRVDPKTGVLYPERNSGADLGKTKQRWNAVYAGNTGVRSTGSIICDSKVISYSAVESNNEVPNFNGILKDDLYTTTPTETRGAQYLARDKNGAYIGGLRVYHDTNGTIQAQLMCRSQNTEKQKNVALVASKDSTGAAGDWRFVPNGNAVIDLGASGQRWAKTYTKRLNLSSSIAVDDAGNVVPDDSNGISFAGTKSTTSMIRFANNDANTYGNGIVIGGGGVVIMGCGESANALYSALVKNQINAGKTAAAANTEVAQSENTYITSDNHIRLLSNCNDIAKRKELGFNTNGQLVYTPTAGGTAYTYTLPQATGTLALTSQLPTKVSELTNDSGFLTSHQTIYDLVFRNSLGSDYVTFTANESGTTVVPIDVEAINETTEEYSLAIGGVTKRAQAKGTYSVALGSNAQVRYTDTIKIGYGMTPNNQSTTQIGTGSYTSTGRALYLGVGRKGFTYMNAAGASWTSASDIRDKTDIQTIDHALDFIKKLKPITYVMNDRERYLIRDKDDNPILDENGKQQYDVEAHKRGDKKKHRRFAGLSAQDTYQAMLDCYNNDTNYAQIVDNNKFDHPDDEYLEQYSMSYERLVPFLIKAIQEQQEQIEKLKSKLGE